MKTPSGKHLTTANDTIDRTPLTPMKIPWTPVVLALLTFGCDPTRGVPREAPRVEELREAAYAGVTGSGDTIRLSSGFWEGSSGQAGMNSATARLVEDLTLRGDIDADGSTDAIAFLSHTDGEGASVLSWALMIRSGDEIVNTVTIRIGDRVQVRSATLDSGFLRLGLVEHGDADPRCCPGDLVVRSWVWEDGDFREIPKTTTGRLTPEVIGRHPWRLTAWNSRELVPDTIRITLAYADGNLRGTSGCNSFSAELQLSRIPGDIIVGPISVTEMMCPGHLMESEKRFLRALRNVNQYGFLNTAMFLGYMDEDGVGAMIFEKTHEEND